MSDKKTTEETPDAFQLEVRDDGVAVVTIDVPGEAQNTLKASFSASFESVIDALEGDAAVKAVVITSGKPNSFLAGADITMLQAAESAEEASALSQQGQAAMSRLEGMSKPVVAAIHGPCLGGGLELALACHARVCSDSDRTQLALPEVQLGLLPGAGGTQRLPRQVGVQAALDMMLTGRRIRPKKALQMGLIEEVVPRPIIVEAAAKRALSMVGQGGALARTSGGGGWDMEALKEYALERNPLGRTIVFQQARKQLFSKTLGNYPAPERIIDAVQLGLEEGMEAGLRVEARHFGELAMSQEAAQLMHVFFSMTALKKASGVDSDAKPRTLSKVGVLGAGLMGAGVSYVTANQCGLPVRIKDRDAAGVSRGLGAIRKIYDGRVRRRALSRADAEREQMMITGTTDFSGFSKCEVVIEAVFEDLDLKHRMVRDVESVCGPETIFASNTSSIPITRIAEASERPETVIGMHYFSPVEKMPLLEIIVTEQTADWVTATCVALGQKQGKTVIVVRDGVGFYTSRILSPYMNEAAQVLSEGVAIEDIDRALKQWGFPVGPITLMDEVGLDVAAKVGPIMIEAFGDRMTPPEAFVKLVEDKRYGRKNGRGFFNYEKGKKKGVDESVYALLGITPERKVDPTQLAERCGLLMVNEAVLCLQEGILREPRDGDIGAIFGLGFPPFRGGPFRYVDSEGAGAVVRKLMRLVEQHGPRFTPADMLVDMAKREARFYD